RGLTDPSERERGEGDSDLRGGEIRIEMFEDAARHPRASAAFRGELRELRRTDLDHRELGGDEEAVREDEECSEKQIPGVHGYGAQDALDAGSSSMVPRYCNSRCDPSFRYSCCSRFRCVLRRLSCPPPHRRAMR